MIRFLLAVLLAIAVAAPLAACGKKGPPKPPGENQYPRTYPAPEPR